MEASGTVDNLPPPQQGVQRHTLAAEEELRLEVGFSKPSTCQILLQRGSCELQGVELARGKPYVFVGGGLKLALFTWYGCVIDVECDDQHLEISYTSDETNCNVAFVNTHAQLEAMRDMAAGAASAPSSSQQQLQGPRVLIVGPTESGKTSLAKVLTAYAVKLGRTPLFVDLDPADNCLTVPGTLSVAPMTRDSVTLESYATTGLPTWSSSSSTSAPPAALVLWHGSLQINPDLFKAQVTAIGRKIDARLSFNNVENASTNGTTSSIIATDDSNWGERSSGIIVNTNGWIQEEGYQLLLHTVHALSINVILILGHDRLYSMFKNALQSESGDGDNTASDDDTKKKITIVKIPRSGGVVSRNATFLRNCRSRSVRQYFYGQTKSNASAGIANTTAGAGPANTSSSSQLTPFLLQIPKDQITLYKFSSMTLSASLLPVAAAQATEVVQMERVAHDDISEKLQHSLLAVCHPHAVAAFEQSGQARDLYASGVAGFCVLERVVKDGTTLHLLSPCAGSLPSTTLLLGDITWMD